MAESDLVEKPLLEKIQDLVGRKPGNYDVAFCVGKEKKTVNALKVILKASSPFLEKEFEEKWEVAVIKEDDGIPLPDFDPIAFELFVKLTSLDSWSLEVLQALNLPLNQILNLLSICRSFEMQKPVETLKKLTARIMQCFGEYKDTDDFLQLSQTNLKSVLGSDEIGIKELDVFHAAIRWAEFQWKQLEVLPTEEQFREVLGDCLFEIRFPVMTFAEFTETRESKDVLTAEESLRIYELIGSTGNKNSKNLKFDSKILPFKTTSRKKAPTLESKQNESLISPGFSRLGSTHGLGSTKNSLNVIDDAVQVLNVNKKSGAPFPAVTLLDKTQLRPQSLESASSLQLPAAAEPLSKKIRWGNKINGFPKRHEHAVVAVGNTIYSYGGEGSSSDPSNLEDGPMDVFVLNVNERENEWNNLSVENSAVNPNQRSGHSAVAHKEFVHIFGGWDTRKQKGSNSTYRFNTETRKWEKPKVTGIVPAARYYHSAVVFGNEMLIYGGYGDEVTNDLYSLDLESFCWSTVITKGIPPSLRWSHSATVHDDRCILIFGGYDFNKKDAVNTIYSFDVNNKTWTALETSGTPPSSRLHHCAFALDGQIFIFGGSDKTDSYLNDVFSYDPETFEWKEVTLTGDGPSPRFCAGCVALNNQVFIFGGENLNEGYLSDTCVLEM